MKQELNAAVDGKMQDMTDAEKVLEEELKVDETNGGGDVGTKGQNGAGESGVDGNGGGGGKGKGGTGVGTGVEHHAGGDRATQDPKGIIRDVQGKEQVKRAEEMARKGRRV